jgi:Transcription factor/nuclear export subunit protein 2
LRLLQLLQLKLDLKLQTTRVQQVHKRLAQEVASYFPNTAATDTTSSDCTTAAAATADAVLAYLVLPRALFSPEDALFAANFVTALHTYRAPGFPTAVWLQACVKKCATMLYACTELEVSLLYSARTM